MSKKTKAQELAEELEAQFARMTMDLRLDVAAELLRLDAEVKRLIAASAPMARIGTNYCCEKAVGTGKTVCDECAHGIGG